MPTILVADDNSNIQKMVSLVFEEKGISVVAVGNGEAACRRVPEVKPDIVLADVFMPVRNGYEVCEFVKRDSRFSETPVILLVGAFDPLDEKEAQRVGADGVLKKPFVPPDPLIAMVGSLLQRSDKTEDDLAEEAARLAPPPPPPPPIAPPVAKAPEPEPEYEEQPEDFSYGTANRDAGEEPQVGTNFRTSAARPSAAHDKEEDDEEPASEWRRRRAAMDFEIPASESSNLVDDLVGQGERAAKLEGSSAVEEPVEGYAGEDAEQGSEEQASPSAQEVAESSVSEYAASAPESEPENELSASPEAPSRTTPGEWMDYIAESSEKSSAAKAQEAAPSQAQPEPEPEPRGAAAPPEFAPPIHSAAAHDEEAVGDAEEIHAQPDESESFQAPPEPEPQPRSSSVIGFHVPSGPPAQAGIHAQSSLTVFAPPPAASEPAMERIHSTPAVDKNEEQEEELREASEPVHETVHESADAPAAPLEPKAAPEPTAQSAKLDDAAIESIVTKVVEKLGPQLQEILSSGVVRPLVKEMLNKTPEKK